MVTGQLVYLQARLMPAPVESEGIKVTVGRDGGSPMDERRLHPSWSVLDDPVTGEVIARLPPHISSEIAAATCVEIAQRLVERAQPTVVVIDLYEVDSIYAGAPLAGVRVLLPVASLIDRFDFIVRRRFVRIAAISAAHVLGVRYTVRSSPR